MQKYNKFWVALLLVAVNVVREVWNVDVGIDPTMAVTIVNGVGAVLVYMVPNR